MENQAQPRKTKQQREKEKEERERALFEKRQKEEEERARVRLLRGDEHENKGRGEQAASGKKKQGREEREKIIFEKRQREEEENVKIRMKNNGQENRAQREQEKQQRERTVYEKRRREEDERAQIRLERHEEEIKKMETQGDKNVFEVCEAQNGLEDTARDETFLHESRENGELVHQDMDDKEERKQKTGVNLKNWSSKSNTFPQKCSYCQEKHSVAQIQRILGQNLDDEVTLKLFQSPPFVLFSVYHYVNQGGKLLKSILKNDAAEKWVEQSLLHDLCNSSSQQSGHIKVEALDQIRNLHGILTTEQILYNLKKHQPFSLFDINEILNCILASGNCTPESIKGSDWLFKLKYKWIEHKLQQSRLLLNKNLIDLFARSRLHFKVIEFLMEILENGAEQAHLPEFVKITEECNLSEQDILRILMQQNASKDINGSRLKFSVYEIQMTSLIKTQSRIDTENSLLLRANLATLLHQGYSFKTMKKVLSHNFISNENIFNFDEILGLITAYQVNEITLHKIFATLKESKPNMWLETVNRVVVDATFGEKQEYKLKEIIDRIMETSSINTNFTKETLKAYYDKIKTVSNEPSKVFGLIKTVSEEEKSKPINSWKYDQVRQWAEHIKGKCFNTKISHQELLQEIIAVIIQGIKLYYELPPRDTQILTVCLLLNSKEGRGCLAQVPTGEGKSLIVAILAIVHSLLRKKVDIITTSTELSIPEAKKQAPFFELFNLTVGENSDVTSKQVVYQRDIVYGTGSNFQADILRSEFQGQPIRGDRGFQVVIVDEVDSMLFDQRTQSTRLSERLPAMDHLELILANIWSLLNLTRRHLIKKDEKYLFIPEDFSIDGGNIVTASNVPEEECGTVIEDPLTFLKENMEQVIEKNLRTLSPDEVNTKTEYEMLNVKSAVLCKSLDKLQNELKLKIKSSSNENKPKADRLTDEIEKLKIHIEEIDESNEEHSRSLKKLDELTNELQQVQEKMEKEVDSNLYMKKKSKVEEQLKLQEEIKKAAWLDEYPVIEVPNHLLEFARQQIPNWVKSALDALYCFQRNKHYAVEGGRIIPINYNDTGVFQPNMVWGNGLTQFLQMKEGLKIQPESVATNYLSTHGYFKRYGHHLYGVTGTLGESSTQEFFEKVYETDQIKVPPHSYRVIEHPTTSYYQCKEFPAKVLSDEQSWIEAICKTCLNQLKVKRCVLVICQYVYQVESLAKELVNVHKYPEDKILKYTGRNKEKFSRTDILPGEVVIATNIAGRGTDLSVNPKAEENGGLHVCITFLPSHFRVELQNVGRTARKGQRGSAQLLLCDSSGITIDEMKVNRNKKEADSLRKAQGDVGKIKLQDQLFVQFCKFLGTLIPEMSQIHKMKEQMQLEDAYEREREAVSDESLEESFNKHTEELLAERLALLEREPQYAQNTASEVESARSAIEKEIDMYRSTEYFNWKANYEEQIRKALCMKWKGKVSYDVLEAFKINISVSGEMSATTSSLDYYDRLSLTEQWGMWQHMTFSAEEMKSEKEILESFKNFTENLRKQVEKARHIQNPFYYIKKGNNKIREKNVDSAIQCYEKAIEMDPRRSLYAHINLARAYLMKSSKKEMQIKAKTEYEKALTLIDSTYKPSLLQLHAIIKQNEGGEKTSEHISHQLDILNVVENHANTAIKVINEAQEKDMEVAITNVESLKNIFKDGDGDEAKDHSQATDEANVNGLTHLAILEAKEPTPWLSIVGVTLLGICQIAVGILATIYTAGTLGKGFIAEGVSDIIAGIKGAITGSFSWATWAMEKAVSISISLICAGFNSIKRNLKAIRNINTSAACFKTGLKLATKQVGMALAKGVAKEVLTYVSDLATEKLLMEKIEIIIEEIVGKALTEAFEKNELIQRGLAIDIAKQNNYYQKLFIREGISLLTEKKESNIVVTYLSRVWRGVIRKKAKNVPIDKLGNIIEEIGNTADPEKLRETTIKFAEKFLGVYLKQIDRYRDLVEKDEHKVNGSQQQTTGGTNKSQQTEFPQSDHKSQQHDQASHGQTSSQKGGDKSQQHTSPESGNNRTRQHEEAFEQQTMPPECDINEDNFGMHDTASGEAYSTAQPQASKKSSFYNPSNSKYLKKEFIKPITKNVTDSVRENVIQPLQEMGTQTVLDYFSHSTQKSIDQQRRAYRSEMRTRARRMNNT